MRKITFDSETTRRIVNGEITAFYREYTPTSAAVKTILDYYKLGDLSMKNRFVPYKDDEVIGYDYDFRTKEIFIHFEEGFLRDRFGLSKIYPQALLAERCFDLSELGHKSHLLYETDNPTPILYKRNEESFYVPWRKAVESELRFVVTTTNVELKRVLDISNDDAGAMGFRKSNKYINLNTSATFRVDDDYTERNAFFLSYFEKHKEDADEKKRLCDNPFIFIINFGISRV